MAESAVIRKLFFFLTVFCLVYHLLLLPSSSPLPYKIVNFLTAFLPSSSFFKMLDFEISSGS